MKLHVFTFFLHKTHYCSLPGKKNKNLKRGINTTDEIPSLRPLIPIDLVLSLKSDHINSRKRFGDLFLFETYCEELFRETVG